jgi:hypothetical protein
LYAAKIAAVRLYARNEEIEAIIAALRAEEQAALEALRVRHRKTIKSRKRIGSALQMAKRDMMRSASRPKRKGRGWIQSCFLARKDL